jgi:DNA-binding CsgD family transcriptional regulator
MDVKVLRSHGLTPKEIEAIQWMSTGLFSNHEIARKMRVLDTTVKEYLRSANRRMKTSSKKELLETARKLSEQNQGHL